MCDHEFKIYCKNMREELFSTSKIIDDAIGVLDHIALNLNENDKENFFYIEDLLRRVSKNITKISIIALANITKLKSGGGGGLIQLQPEESIIGKFNKSPIIFNSITEKVRIPEVETIADIFKARENELKKFAELSDPSLGVPFYNEGDEGYLGNRPAKIVKPEESQSEVHIFKNNERKWKGIPDNYRGKIRLKPGSEDEYETVGDGPEDNQGAESVAPLYCQGGTDSRECFTHCDENERGACLFFELRGGEKQC